MSIELVPEEHTVTLARRASRRYPFSATGMDRNLKEYCGLLCLDIPKVFRNKRILDLGAGATAIMTRQARQRGVDVVACNPNWQARSFCVKHKVQVNQPMVAGIVEQLPFKSQSFAGIVSLYGPPAHLPPHVDHYSAFGTEVQRVLEPGGFLIHHGLYFADEELLRIGLDRSVGSDSCLMEPNPGVSALIIGKDAAALEQPVVRTAWGALLERVTIGTMHG